MVKLGYEKVIDNKHAYIFKSPITGIMDYDQIVKKPKCYLDIKRLMDQNEIDDLMKLRMHFFLMLANSVMYNNFDSEYYGFAKEMFEDADKLLSDDVMLSNFNDSEEKSLRTSSRHSSKMGMQPRSRESSVLASTPTSSRPVTPAPDDDDMSHSVTAKRGRPS